MKLPLAITMGDPSGIGPEIIVGAWERLQEEIQRPLVVIGCSATLAAACQLRSWPHRVVSTRDLANVPGDKHVIPVWELGPRYDDVVRGNIDPRGGAAAGQAVTLGVELAMAGAVAGIVTAPLQKEALQAAGYQVPGHTELLGKLCGVSQVAMMLYLPPPLSSRSRPLDDGDLGLGVVHVTLHRALRQVFEGITVERIKERVLLAQEFFQSLLTVRQLDRTPRIGVAALNPHAGEGGLFGDEELTIIGPAVAALQERRCQLTGPLPCDTLMHRAAAGEFDAVVAMYHDQGHIALKLLGLQRAVNITLGLPIIRTSVAHGTAFDIAWQGRANPGSLIEAVKMADQLANAAGR